MAIEWYYINQYLALGVDFNWWGNDTTVSCDIVPYRWDMYDTNNYAGRFSETLYPDTFGSGSWSGLTFGSGYGTRQLERFATRTYQRGHTAYNVTLTISWTSIGTAWGYAFHELGSGSHTWTLTIDPKTSYQVQYNANGGSGAPGNQTKWHDETLTLSSVKPTRDGYTFVGWATSSGGNVVYAPGASYTSNAGITLYAVWKINYIPPTISNLYGVRCDSGGTPSNNGAYIKLSGSWIVDTTVNTSNKATSLKIEYRSSDTSSWTVESTTNPASVKGTISSVIGGGKISTNNAYYVKVTVYDNGGSSTRQVIVSPQFRPFDIANRGESIAFGAPASETNKGVDFFTPGRFQNGLYCNSLYLGSNDTTYTQMGDFIVAQGVSGGWRYRKWSSGVAECWKVVTIHSGDFILWNQYSYIYCASNKVPGQVYPFPFIDPPCVDVSTRGVSPGMTSYIAAQAPESDINKRKTQSQDIWVVCPTLSKSGNIEGCFYAHGRYK